MSAVEYKAAYRRRDAAAFLSVSVSSVDRLITSGRLKTVKVGEGCTRILGVDLKAYVDSLTVPA